MEISPNGKKFFFTGFKPKIFIKQPEPEWELVWSSGKGEMGSSTEAQWLNDSSNVVIRSKDKLFIEEISKNNIHQFNIDLGLIQNLRIDKSNRIYILASPKPPTWPKIFSSDLKYRLLRCSIKEESLDCEDILKRNKSIAVGGYAITQDGRNIIFVEEGKTWEEKRCIWHLKEGGEAKCITPLATIRSTINISPDGKWMTFLRPRKIETIRGTDVYTDDLFLISLINE